METNCCLIFDLPTKALRDKAAEFLTVGSRPVFEDEVEPEFQSLFNALEYTEYADDLRIDGNTGIHAYFFMGGDFDEDVRYFFKCLHDAGTLNAFAAIEADEFEGLLCMDGNGRIKTLGNEYRKIMKFVDVTDDEELDDEEDTEDDLATFYQRLEQVKKHWMAENSSAKTSKL